MWILYNSTAESVQESTKKINNNEKQQHKYYVENNSEDLHKQIS